MERNKFGAVMQPIHHSLTKVLAKTIAAEPCLIVVVFDACACLYERGFLKCEIDGRSAFVAVIICGRIKGVVVSSLCFSIFLLDF